MYVCIQGPPFVNVLLNLEEILHLNIFFKLAYCYGTSDKTSFQGLNFADGDVENEWSLETELWSRLYLIVICFCGKTWSRVRTRVLSCPVRRLCGLAMRAFTVEDECQEMFLRLSCCKHAELLVAAEHLTHSGHLSLKD